MNNPARFTRIFLFIIFLASGWPLTAVINAQDKLVYKIGVDKNCFPMSFEDQSGKMSGFFREYSDILMRRIRAEYELQPMEKSEIYGSLAQGLVDFCMPVELPPEGTEKTLGYSLPIITENIVIIVRKERKDVRNLEDLRGTVTAVWEGESSLPLIEAAGGVTLKKYPSEKDALGALISAEAGACITGIFRAEYHLKLAKAYSKFRFVKEPVNAVDYAIAVKKGNDYLLNNKLNPAVEKTLDSAVFERLYKRYFYIERRLKYLAWSRNTAVGIIGIYLLYFLGELLLRLWRLGLKTESFLLMLGYKRRAEWYRKVIENSDDMIFFLDPAYNFLLCNKKTEKTLMYPEDELVKMSFLDFVVEDKREDFSKYAANVEKYGIGRLLEIDIMNAKGEVMTVEFTATTHIFHKKFSGISVVARNVTEKKRTYLETKYREEKYSRIFRDFGYPAVIIDPENLITEVNAAFLLFSGFSEKELIGKPVEMFFVSEEQPQDLVLSRLMRLRERFELKFYIGKRVLRILDLYVFPFERETRDSENRVIVLTDKSKIVADEKKLREDLYFFQVSVSGANFPVVALDAKGAVKYLNKDAEEKTGYNAEVAKNRTWVDLMGYTAGKKVYEALQYFERGGGMELEDEIRTASGETKLCLFSISFLFDKEGNKYLMLFSFVDISKFSEDFRAVNELRYFYENIMNEMPLQAVCIRKEDGAEVFKNSVLSIPDETLSQIIARARKQGAGDFDLAAADSLYRIFSRPQEKTLNIFIADITERNNEMKFLSEYQEYFVRITDFLKASPSPEPGEVMALLLSYCQDFGISEIFLKTDKRIDFHSAGKREHLRIALNDYALSGSSSDRVYDAGDGLLSFLRVDRKLPVRESVIAFSRRKVFLALLLDAEEKKLSVLKIILPFLLLALDSALEFSGAVVKQNGAENFAGKITSLIQEAYAEIDASGRVVSHNDVFFQSFASGTGEMIIDITGGADGAYEFIRDFIRDKGKSEVSGVLSFRMKENNMKEYAVRLARDNDGRIYFFSHPVTVIEGAVSRPLPAASDRLPSDAVEKLTKNIETLNYYMNILSRYMTDRNIPPELRMYLSIFEDNIRKLHGMN